MTNYPTNVSDSNWQIIVKYLDTERNRKYHLREIALISNKDNAETFLDSFLEAV